MQRAVAVPLFVNGRSWNRPWRERGPAVPFARPPVKEPVPHGHQSRTRSPVKGGARRGTKDVVAAFRARQPSCSRAHHVCRASRRRRCGRARRQQKQASQYDTRCLRDTVGQLHLDAGEKSKEKRPPHELFRRTGQQARWTRIALGNYRAISLRGRGIYMRSQRSVTPSIVVLDRHAAMWHVRLDIGSRKITLAACTRRYRRRDEMSAPGVLRGRNRGASGGDTSLFPMERVPSNAPLEATGKMLSGLLSTDTNIPPR
ncbi:hypothetical protein MRX96_006895 [Rhipicephalus microplus]